MDMLSYIKQREMQYFNTEICIFVPNTMQILKRRPKVQKKVSKGYKGKHCSIPFENAAVTNGRKAIRRMLSFHNMFLDFESKGKKIVIYLQN